MSQPICPRSWYKMSHVRCTMTVCSSVGNGRLSSSSRCWRLLIDIAVSASSLSALQDGDLFVLMLHGDKTRPNLCSIVDFVDPSLIGQSLPFSCGQTISCRIFGSADSVSSPSPSCFGLDVCEPIAELCLKLVNVVKQTRKLSAKGGYHSADSPT